MPPYPNNGPNNPNQPVDPNANPGNQFPAPMPPAQPQPYNPGMPQLNGQLPQAPGTQSYGEPVSDDPARYDFFLNPSKPQSSTPFNGSSKKLMFIAGGIVLVLVLVVTVVMSSSSGGPNTDPLLAVAQAQQEVVRVATDGVKNNQSTALKNFSVTAQSTVSSAQQQTLSLMATQGTKVKVNDKLLKLTASAQTDKALAAAIAASSYDITYKTIMQSDLDTYENKLDNASTLQTSASAKKLLQQQHDGAALLEKQLNL